jgi:hypothetical protein
MLDGIGTIKNNLKKSIDTKHSIWQNRCVQSRTNNQQKYQNTMKYKDTIYKNFIISGSHRHRISFVMHPTKINPRFGSNEILFTIEKEQDYFLSHKTGCSYFVQSSIPNQGNFLAESWKEVIAKLNEILA